MSATATIKPDKVLKELANLWIETAAYHPDDAQQGNAVLRACAMTMIVLAEESDDPQEIADALARLMQEHPSRAIVIRLRESGDPFLAERVFAQCWKPFGARQQICCEQIEITASDASLPELGAVVLPLVVADLPVVLWCRSGRAAGLPGFRDLASLAQKVIFNSARFANPDRALRILTGSALRGVRVADLAWGRLTRSRELVAQAVASEDILRSLSSITTVVLRVRGPEPDLAARYFAAWLTSRLRLIGAQPRVEWKLGPADRPTSINGVELRAKAELILSFEVQEAVANGVVVDLNVNDRTSRAVLLRPSEFELLLEELALPSRDLVYEAALAQAAAD